MQTGAHEFDQTKKARLSQAAMLMQQALALLDQAGESRAATHLQHAIDTLALR